MADVEIADYEDKALKGRIGLARRIHYLLEIAGPPTSPSWGSSACGAWAGRVVLVPKTTPVSCRPCLQLALPTWRVPATKQLAQPPGGGGVY